MQLAIQTYELVDKHIRRLDSDLARFEGEIHDKAMTAKDKTEESVGKSKSMLDSIELDINFLLKIIQKVVRRQKTRKSRVRKSGLHLMTRNRSRRKPPFSRKVAKSKR